MKLRARFAANPFLWALIVLLLATGRPLSAPGADHWPGVDEKVVERYAREHGREAKKPLINTDQGDILLFVFLVAGAAGGFVAGYSWRMLLGERGGKPSATHDGTVEGSGGPGGTVRS